jgi:antitoxin component YwqK of YwqJK toxin-antitoxin module
LGWVVDLGKELFMKRLFIISLLFLSVGLSQQKWNMEFMREYGGVTYAPNSDKPYTGSVFSLDSLGTKKEEGKYRNGLKDGRWTYYTTVGNRKYEITYKAGIYTLAVFTDKLGTDYTGSPITDEPEQDGTFLYQDEDKYDFSKYPMVFGTIKDGQKDGLWIDWHENGQKKREETFKDGKEISKKSWEYYGNGQKKGEETYKNDKKDGKWTIWYENGQKWIEGTYEDGKKNGLWTYWYKSGDKVYEGSYMDGNENKLWRWWYESGQKRLEGSFSSGEEIGQWLFFTINGEQKKCDPKLSTKIYSSDGIILGQLFKQSKDLKTDNSVIDKTSSTNIQHCVQYIRNSFSDEDINIFRYGYNIYSSIDFRLQQIADKSMMESVFKNQEKLSKSDYDSNNNSLIQCAFVALDPSNGGLLAMIGGRSDYQDQYNRAVQTKRQPGSVFQPIVYTTALENRNPVTEQLLNQPVVLNVQNMDGSWVKWKPQNYDLSTGGLTTLREGLRKSMNLISVRMVQQDLAPAEQIKKIAKRMGITTDIRAVDAIALGTSEVIPLELVAAYAAFANRGVYSKPFAITRIEDRYGHVVKEYFPDQKEVLSAETAYLMTSLLQTVLDRGTGGSARWKYNFNRPAAGKTGTTQGWSDAWFVGYTPQIATGVWFGVDDFQVPLGPGQDGSRAALPAWARFMREAHDVLNYKVEKFEMPKGVQYVEICSVTKKAPLKACPTEREMFQVGTEPIQACKVHRMDREVIPSTKVNTVVPPNFYKVPNLFGLSQNKAVENLVRSGLKLGKVFYRQNEDLLPYTVLDQSISADTILEESTHVDLTVSVLHMQDIFNQIDK